VAANQIFGNRRLDEIDRKDIARFRAVRAKIRAPGTVNRDLAVVKRMFNLAVDVYGYLDKNPARKVEMLKELPKEKRVLSYDEEEALIQAAADHLKSVLIVGFDVGLRISDLLALQWRQVDLDAQTITPQIAKSKKFQPIRMTPRVETALRAIPHRVGPVFLYSGATILSVKKSFATAVEDAQIARATPHDMRRTFATRLYRAGRSLAEIQALLGHADIHTTMRYIGVTAANLSEAIDALAADREAHLSNLKIVKFPKASVTKVSHGPNRKRPKHR
jgi:integrase